MPTTAVNPAKPGRLGSRGSAESRKWWTLAAVSLAAFMTYLDSNALESTSQGKAGKSYLTCEDVN